MDFFDEALSGSADANGGAGVGVTLSSSSSVGAKRGLEDDANAAGELQQQEHTTLDDVLVPLASPTPDLKKQKLLDAELPDVDDEEQFPEEEEDEGLNGLTGDENGEEEELVVDLDMAELAPSLTPDNGGESDGEEDGEEDVQSNNGGVDALGGSAQQSGESDDEVDEEEEEDERDENDIDIVDVDDEDDGNSAQDDEESEEEDEEEDEDLSVGNRSSRQYGHNEQFVQSGQQQYYGEEEGEEEEEVARLRVQENNKREARGLLNQLDSSARSKLCLTALEKYGEELFYGHEEARDAILVDACAQESILGLMKEAIRVRELYARGTSAAPLELDDDEDDEDDGGYEDSEEDDDEDTERGTHTNEDEDEDDEDEDEDDNEVVLISEEETDGNQPQDEENEVEDEGGDDDEQLQLDAEAAELATAPDASS